MLNNRGLKVHETTNGSGIISSLTRNNREQKETSYSQNWCHQQMIWIDRLHALHTIHRWNTWLPTLQVRVGMVRKPTGERAILSIALACHQTSRRKLKRTSSVGWASGFWDAECKRSAVSSLDKRPEAAWWCISSHATDHNGYTSDGFCRWNLSTENIAISRISPTFHLSHPVSLQTPTRRRAP